MNVSPSVRTNLDRLRHGARQPLVGLRAVLRHPPLLRAALVPALLLALLCLAFARLSPGTHGFGRRFYELFAWLAPFPSVVLAPHYARMAVQARAQLGFGPSSPCIEGFWRASWRALSQATLIAVGVAPAGVLEAVPLVGHVALQAVLGAWALHWIVIDAFDSARVLEPGETFAERDAASHLLPSPWFVRGTRHLAARLPRALASLARGFARFCDWLARPWRDEMQLAETHPSLVLGFALSTAALLATPALNLLFRPIVLVGAVHVLGQLAAADPPVTRDPPSASPPAAAAR
jgi:hypothetical protein